VVIPIHDQNPTRNRAYLTLALIGLNVVIFLFSPAVHGPLTGGGSARQQCADRAYYQRWGAIPIELTRNQPLPYTWQPGLGGSCVAAEPSYHKIPIVSAVTSQFIHAGWLHLLGNMLFLWVFGNNVEDRFGRIRFATFYLAGGVISSYVYAFSFPDSTVTLVGASGAIAGVLGAYLMLFPRARVYTIVLVVPLWLRAWLVLGLWFVLQAVNAELATNPNADSGSIGYLVHVVGFVLGLAYGLWFRSRHPPPSPVPPPRWPPSRWPRAR
jgi:membrane associated rhomboid family serine protease